MGECGCVIKETKQRERENESEREAIVLVHYRREGFLEFTALTELSKSRKKPDIKAGG